MKVRIATVTMALTFMGMTTLMRNFRLLQPSTFAALNREGGVCMKYSCSIKM